MKISFATPGLFVGNIKAAVRAASEDQARPICYVRLEIRRADSAMPRPMLEFPELRASVVRFVATDGHWLWINEAPCQADGEGVFMFTRDDAVAMLKTIDVSKKASKWAVEIDTDTRTVSQLSSVFEYADCDATRFPPYQQVLPSPESLGENPVSVFDATLMARISASFLDISGLKANARGVSLAFHTSPNHGQSGHASPIVITSSSSFPLGSALAVLMPMRNNVSSATQLLTNYREHSATKAA